MPEVTVTLSGEFFDKLQELIRRTISDELEGAKAGESGFLDVDGAADFLASSPTAVRSLVKRHAIPFYKSPAGRLLFDRDKLDAWVRSG